MPVVNLEAQPPPPVNDNKREYNLLFMKTREGVLRLFEGVLAIAAIIMLVEGYCEFNTGRYGTIMFVLIVTLIESIFISVVMIMRLNETFTLVDVTLSIFLNDAVLSIFHFITANLALLSIGSCDHTRVARLLAAVFILALLFVMVVQDYLNYLKWMEKKSSQESAKTTGTTITESSPTVLT
ncbi:uncharacterized protein CDAR_229931 [Caerostris darwini]|uniref:MARVEL domain-containing protein n=2 Tax=Caerostris TaxID=172845 RepID=A0AAV4Q113_9ARAC|nr:uncharacterized protein CDAR_229931 [Caerostris darwini]